jgi:hypothetical protein
MEKERKYEVGYKPKIVLANCTITYTKIKTKRASSLQAKKIVMVLDDNNKIPTDRMREKLITRIWATLGISGKEIEHESKLTNLSIISEHGRINYKFDEFKH